MTSPNGQFLDLNAQLVQRHPNIHKLRPGVVRRTHPEPDRSHVEGAPPPKPPTALDAREKEPEPVAAKKKRTRLDPETWEVAVARVQSLVGAGNTAKGSIEKVAKEHNVSFSALAKRYNDAPKPKAKKKARAAQPAPNGAAPAVPVARDALATEVLSAFAAWLDAGVREVVRQEIRRMLA